MKKILSYLTIFLLFVGVTNAAAFGTIIDNWNLNLSVLNGEEIDGTTLSGLDDANNIDYIDLTGQATVYQDVSGGSTAGQDFYDDGYIAFDGYREEGASFNSDFETAGYNLYVEYVGLSGVINADDTITFDTGLSQLGTINMYLTNDSDAQHATNSELDLLLVSFDIIAPSGGSDLDFYGGGGDNATIDLTLQASSMINSLLFTDENNDSLDTPFILHLANVDSLLDDDFNPNPDNTGVDEDGNGVSVIHVENAGQYKLSVVPEPTTFMLFGIGLLGIARVSRKRKS